MKHLKDYALIVLTAFVAVFCYRSCNGINDIQVVESIVHDTITKTVPDMSPLEDGTIFAFGYAKLKDKLVELFGAENVVDC